MALMPKDPWSDEDELLLGGLTIEEQKALDWRLLCLLRAYREHCSTYGEEEINALTQLARSKADLRQMEKAFASGCSLANALRIFV